MATVFELLQKRDLLYIQIAGVTADLKEYTQFPVETVDIEQIKYQYLFILREIKQADDSLKGIFLAQFETLKFDFELISKKIIENLSEKKFTVGDLPKLHFSMFNEPFI